MWRARYLDMPVVLGSATPSLESLFNVEQQRYRRLALPERTGVARLPAYELIDVRPRRWNRACPRPCGAHPAATSMRTVRCCCFSTGAAIAPTLMCYGCDWIAGCPRCDARMTWHHSETGCIAITVAASGRSIPTCPACRGRDLRPLGQGTERVEQALAEHFPEVERLRIDRDTTRRKGELDALLEQARARHGAQLLLGTQMLAKGHHFPDVTLVGILDADHGLFSSNFAPANAWHS